MSKRSQSRSHTGAPRIDRKMRWLSGSSMAAAAFLLTSAPQNAQAQSILRASELDIPNIRMSAPVSAPPVNDVRISAPIAQLPNADLRISTPIVRPHVTDIRFSGPVSLQPHSSNQQFSSSEITITPHTPINLDPVSISTLVSGLVEPHNRVSEYPVRDISLSSAPAGLIAINQPQAIGSRISATQAFQANTASATAAVSTTSNSDVVSVFGPETFINWVPLDTANSDDLINILPAGTSLTFVGPGSGYTVLNRILPTGTATSGDPRGIAFSGNVTSRLGATDGSIGGNIWFYSPGGIVVGANAVFDVGGLVLTTNDIDTTGGLFGAAGEIRFSGTAGSTSAVTIENGAQINAVANGSNYVAMVASRVVQGGTVTVNGSAAYVAAEQADLTINNGLFDISIGLGTTDANGVVHSGTTTGQSSSPSFNTGGEVTDADARAIYMVAVPKNDALTMLVGGNLGYQPAATASIVNGNVVLSAGANVATTGDQTNASFAFDKTAADSDSNIQFQNVSFGSSVSAFATNGISLATASAADSIVANNTTGTQNLLLEARNQIDINARGGGTIGANGNVTLRAGTDGVGGTININADQVGFGDSIVSGLIATGDLIVDVSASGLDDFFTVRNNGGTGIGQDAVGGNINIDISGGGDLVVGGSALFDASAQGGKGENQNGSGQGGNINLNISSGTFNVTGTTFFDSQVIDAQNLKIAGNGPGPVGSDSVAGDISLNLSGGAVTTGGMEFNFGAVASAGDTSGGAQSNDATAGVFDLTVTGGTHIIDNVQVYATADAGTGSFTAAGVETSGYASSGGANVLIAGGSLTINSDLQAELNTYGIAPAAVEDRATLTVQNGANLAVGGNLSISTRAFNGSDSVTSTGGSISIVADNATISAGGIFLDTSGKPNDQFFSTDPTEGKDFQAGDINLVARNGGSFTAGFSNFDASATGNDTIAGNATGGDILIHANDGSIAFTGFVGIDASGIGGVGGDNQDPASLASGRGGAVIFRVQGSSGSMTLTDLDVDSDGSISVGGEGGAPRFEGDGGLGFGGDVTFDLLGGTFAATNITVGSDGSGGGGGDLFTVPAPTTLGGVTALAAPEDLPLAVTSLAGDLPALTVTPSAGGVSAGDGGDGQGGNVTFNLNGGNATVTNITIAANGFGGNGADGDISYGTAGGAGGSGIGGDTTFNAISGNLTVTSTLTVSADGNNQNIAPYGSSGAGGYGYGSDAGNGGAGIGGTATFNLDGSATISAANIVVSTIANGGYGASSRNAFDGLGNLIQAGTGGRGGDATGGDATFNNNAGTLNFGQLTVNSIGTGGDGGDVFGISTGQADNIAGDGGSGIGGNATININQDDLNNPIYVVDASGIGGDGGNGLDGGEGGAAFGGIAAININGTTAVLDDPTIFANATGGAGGEGRINPATFNAGNSGGGGDATGGTARLEVSGTGGNIDLGFIIQQSDAVGGQGGAGYGNFSADGGSGGDGGNATGGRSEMIARTGGTINLTSATFDFTSTGTGGTGGDGGYSYANTPGDGGDGGFGTGGTAVFLAQGGTITGQDVNFTVTGIGGDGGIGGAAFLGYNGITGNGGSGTGGTATIEVQEGSPGIITLGNVVASANGTSGTGLTTLAGAGGRIEITDTSTDPAGLISLNSLTANAFDNGVGSATGSASAPLGGFFVTGNSGAMAIVGDLTVNTAGNIEYALDGDGQMTVGGNATLTSGQNILIDHSNNVTPVNSIAVSGNFAATAQADFISTAGSRINAAGTATVRTGQNATVADIAGVGLVDISAMWDANVTNAAVTGPPTVITSFVNGPQMLIQAGHDPAGTPSPSPTASFDPNYDATISGDVTSTGRIDINAGGSALFSTGSSTVSDNGLTVQTGDDIIIQTGASLVAGNNAATTPNTANPFPDTNNLFLQAGSLTPLSTATLTPIASIVAAGNIDANDFAVVMSANAIDGLGGTITASSVSADINDAPSNAVIAAIGQSDDNGLLSAQCVEGNICLGALSADNFVYIGQASNNNVVQGIVESGTVSANDILVTIRNDIIMGTDGIATVLNASNRFLVESTEGDVDLRDASINSASVQVSAVNGSLRGSASLTSTNDIGITVGADIAAASITTGGQLTTVALVGGPSESVYTVPGSIKVDAYTQGTAQRFRVEAGNDALFGQISVPDSAIELIAAQSGPGDVFLGTTSGASNIILQGENVSYTDLDATVSAASSISILATNGNITGGDSASSFTTDLDATGGISFGSLGATGAVTADAGGDIAFTTVAGSDTITMTAGGSNNGGDIDATGAVTIGSGGEVILDTITGGGDIGIVANNASNVTAGSLNSAANVDVLTQGAFVADEVNAAQSGTGQVAIAAGNGITLRNVSGNGIGLTALNGLVNVTNNVDVTNLLTASGTAVSIITQQDMRVSADATNGDIGLSSTGSLDVQGAQATGDIMMASGSDILISSLINAANDLQITAGGLIDIQASVVGNTIRTVSADMNIGSAGNLGQTDLTSDIQIFSDGTTQMLLGDGTDLGGTFSLNNDEFSRIHSGGDLTLTAVPTSIDGFDMVVQNLNVLVADNVSGPQAANIGLSNSLNLVSGQSITVVGLLDFANGNADSGLNFTAGEDLFIDAAGGIIQMTNANGEFAGSGSLSITAPNVYAMTSQALADIAGLSAADIDLRLADNDGIDLADGLIRADNVLITITDNLLIQNTATGTAYADRRGFTAGSLSIAGPSTGSANIVINGIVGGATGLDTIPATDVGIGFDPASTINGCLINDPASCAPTPTPGPDDVATYDPVQDVIEEEVTPKKYVADPFASTPIEIKENAELAEEPLIDEPVTGAGNEDLWVGEAEEDDEEQEEALEPAE